jgi:hypothetical protein
MFALALRAQAAQLQTSSWPVGREAHPRAQASRWATPPEQR